MRVQGAAKVTGQAPKLVRVGGEPVLVIEVRNYSAAEVARNLRLLADLLRSYDCERVVRNAPMTYREFADAIGVSVKWVQRRVAKGLIPHYRVGSKVLFEPAALEATREALRRGDLPAPKAVRAKAWTDSAPTDPL